MSKRKLFSSNAIAKALEHAGFELRSSSGAHEIYIRPRPGGGHYHVVVPRGKREIPKGTFESILEMAHMSYDEFLAFAGIRAKGRKSIGPEAG